MVSKACQMHTSSSFFTFIHSTTQMNKLPTTGLCLLVVAMAVLLTGAHLVEAVTCRAMELSPCYVAITSSTKPSAACCNKLRQQQPCFCGYLKNPSLGDFVRSPGAKVVASSCRVRYPKC